ncbi:MAG: hypothetical protein IT454_14140 [Planctomycetes bacterium]|nr:hypothetical protein [Planctomycetota bacterium]
MAAQEQTNQLAEMARALKRRVWQVLLPAAVILAAGSALAKLLPRKYTATTGLELRESTLPLSGQGMDEKTIQRDVSNTAYQITQYERVKRVVEKLEWPEYTALAPLDQFEFIKDQQKNIKVGVNAAKNLQGSSFISISYTCEDPKRAEQFLNRLREAYTSEVLERYRQDAKRSLEVLRNNMTIAQDEARECDEQAAEFKKEHGISATQQAPGGGRTRDEDPVFKRLDQAQNNLLDIELSIASDTAGLATLKEQFKSEPLEVPEKLQTSSGLSFDQELEKIEKEVEDLREVQKEYKEAHSGWQQAERKIRKLLEKKEALLEKVRAPISQTAMRPNPQREVLAAQIQAKELTLKQSEARRAQLEADVRELKKEQAARTETFRQIQDLDRKAMIAADTLLKRTTEFQKQKSFVDLLNEGSNPFEVTEFARASKTPNPPGPGIITAIAGVLGLGIGLAWATISEFGRNGFRSPGDTARALGVPVLGVINRITTRSERRADLTRRSVVGLSTVSLVAAILWISWAYENRPQVLGHELVRAITEIKEALR